MNQLRPELRDLPERMKSLPIDERGYPTPAFVDTRPDGVRDFRFMSREHWWRCVHERRCWVCGQKLGAHLAFVVGPMCVVNRTTSEPPGHLVCGTWSAKYCPFLSRPKMVRREDELTLTNRENSAGCPILRNPGCCAVLVTRDYEVWRDDQNRPLITMGEPEEVFWFTEGREATRAEVLASMDSGMPLLEEQARLQEGAMEELAARRAAVEIWLPK